MAELSIGKHCSFAQCHQLDFLPCPCSGCGLDYCKAHMAYESHQCIRKDLTVVGASSDGAVGCQSYACSVNGCCRKELVLIGCEACGINVCLLHRHPDDHSCKSIRQPQERMTQTAEHVRQILATSDATPKQKCTPRSEKSRVTAAKVALMKLKQKAIGDKGIPDLDKVFFKIILPQRSNTTSASVYVNKTWSVGRAVDSLATVLGVKNENNTATAKRLCLFESVNGVMLPNDQLLISLLGSGETVEIYNGCSLILDYTDRNVTKLPSLEAYANFI